MDEEIQKIVVDYLTSGNMRMRREGDKIILEIKNVWGRWEEVCSL